MKLRSALELLGFRASPKVYGHRIETFDLPTDGTVRFAQWLHPKCRPTIIEQEAVDALRAFIRPGDAVLDIGAHSGDTAVLFALAAGGEGRVFAVEPNRYVLPVLEANAGLNPQAAPITVLGYAATETDMQLVFDYSDAGFCNGGDLSRYGRLRGGHPYRLAVEGRNIAQELAKSAPEWLPRINFIKTDTEGNDQAVIRSLRSLISARRPYILSEVFLRTGETERRAFHQFLAGELNYRIHRAEPYRQLVGQPLGPDDMMSSGHFDIFCVPAERQS